MADTDFEIDVAGPDDVETDVVLGDGAPAAAAAVEPDEIVVDDAPAAKADEAAEYSDRVSKRIGKLTRRAKEAERERDEAVSLARNALSQTKTLDRQALAEHTARLNGERESLKTKLKTANALGDSDGATDLQVELADNSAALQLASQANRRQESDEAAAPAASAPAPRQPAAATRPDPEAEDWAAANPWFGENQTASYKALAIHKDLVEEGFDTGTKAYYSELDSRIDDEMPDLRAKPSRTAPTARTVAAPSRTAPGGTRTTGRRTVRLTKTQVALAKRLGLTLEQYAAQVKG